MRRRQGGECVCERVLQGSHDEREWSSETNEGGKSKRKIPEGEKRERRKEGKHVSAVCGVGHRA